jgi:tetratricopeptide (TPR) repeat protein
MLSPAARALYNLPYRAGPQGLTVRGINGTTDVDLATVDKFTFLNVQFRAAKFLVGGNDFPSGAVGTLGGKLFRLADVEYDFADGLMRFVTTKHCGGVPLAYWARNEPIGVVDLRPNSAARPFLIGHALVNGKDIRVEFDTGTPRSIITLAAAKRVGITPESPGVAPAGEIFGIGRNRSKSWIAPVALFEIGGEKIAHTHLLIGDFKLPELRVDMLLGADFFLSHHVYVANGRHKLYFTYNGGPVFALGQQYLIKRAGSAPTIAGPGSVPLANSIQAGSTMSPSSDGGAGRQGPVSGNPASGELLMRQGMAFASEGQFAPALADLDRACRLYPKDPECRFQRAEVYGADKQPHRALADLDAAIKLEPNFYQAHLARAELLLDWRQAPAEATSQALADANIVDLLAPEESELRLPLAQLYSLMGQYVAAIREVDHWLNYHGNDVQLPAAWNARCWFRAEANRHLNKALKDCNRALKRLPKTAPILDSRGLVYLRLGRLHRSIEDYDAALKINPRNATSLYGRGLAELRTGNKGSGDADLASALRVDPGVGKRFARMGLRP